MSASISSDPFNNIIQSFKEIRFIESDAESCSSQINEDMVNLLKMIDLDEPNDITKSYTKSDKVLKRTRKLEDKFPIYDPTSSPNRDLYLHSLENEFDNDYEKDLLKRKSPQSVDKDNFSMLELLPCLENQKKKKEPERIEKPIDKKEKLKKQENEPRRKKKVKTEATQVTNQMLTSSDVPNSSTETSERPNTNQSEEAQKNSELRISEDKPINSTPSINPVLVPSSTPGTNLESWHLLFANPANLFYKKMGNERHYYISQIANGSTGMFLEKPDWKISKEGFDLSKTKDDIYKKAKRIISLLSSNQINMQNLNNQKIDEILQPGTPLDISLPQELEKEINEVQNEFEDYISKNVYGKKQHAYKIPNAEELQKLLMIPKNYNVKDHIPRIFLRVCLRVLFEQFFNDTELYNLLVDKIIEHVQEEVDKKKKDTAEKLPELKKIFYKINRVEFSQKFLDPPSQLKAVKANFNYKIPPEDLKNLFMDFWEMIHRLQELEDNRSAQTPKSFFFTQPQTEQETKGGDLWMVFPFQNEQTLNRTQAFLSTKEIPSFKAMVTSEQGSLDQKPTIEVWNENGVLQASFKFVDSTTKEPQEKKIEGMESGNGLKISGAEKLILQSCKIQEE